MIYFEIICQMSLIHLHQKILDKKNSKLIILVGFYCISQ